MSDWNSIDEIFDFAIKNEVEAAAFYRDLVTKSDSAQIRTIFEGFAREEDGHKAKLERVRAGGEFKMPKEKIMDLKIADYLVDVEPEEGTDYQRALILAMHKEKAAFKLYTDLAAAADDQKVKDLMMSLANEEAKHKLRFEIEYDDNILMEN